MRIKKQVYTEMHNFDDNSGAEYLIPADRKTFEALLRQMYNDPLGAMIREVVSNAVDAQYQNNSTTPIEIHLPTVLEPYFQVKDYGCGLASDNQSYWTMNKSDKDDTDDLIGGFGLGSKTPLNIASQFTTETYYQGKFYTYSSYFQSNGIPKFQLISQEDKDGVGTTITVPVDIQKYPTYLFVEKAKQYLQFFKMPLKFTGAKVNFDEVAYEDKDYLTLKDKHYGYNIILIGEVPYYVDFKYADNGSIYVPFIMKFQISDGLEISAGREKIQNTTENAAILSQKFQSIIDEKSKVFHNNLDKCANIFEAAELYMNSGFKNILTFKYKNVEATEAGRLNLHVNRHYQTSTNVQYRKTSLYVHTLSSDNTIILVDDATDIKVKIRSAISKYMRGNGIDKVFSISKQYAEAFNNAYDIDKLEIPKFKSNTKKSYIYFNALDVYGNCAKPNFDKPGIYIYGRQNTPYNAKMEYPVNSHKFRQYLETLNIRKSVWLLNKNEINKLPNTWVYFWDLLDKVFEKYKREIIEKSTHRFNNLDTFIYTTLLNKNPDNKINRLHYLFDSRLDETPQPHQEILYFKNKYKLIQVLDIYDVMHDEGVIDEVKRYIEWKDKGCVCNQSTNSN